MRGYPALSDDGAFLCFVFNIPVWWGHYTEKCFNINFPLQPSRGWTSQRSDLLKVEVPRLRHSLGMVIEGGRDTAQEEARIINILPGGAAFETGGLRVGQIIKEVEGLNLKGG